MNLPLSTEDDLISEVAMYMLIPNIATTITVSCLFRQVFYRKGVRLPSEPVPELDSFLKTLFDSGGVRLGGFLNSGKLTPHVIVVSRGFKEKYPRSPQKYLDYISELNF